MELNIVMCQVTRVSCDGGGAVAAWLSLQRFILLVVVKDE